MYVRVCLRAGACVHMRAYVCTCVRAHMHAYTNIPVTVNCFISK